MRLTDPLLQAAQPAPPRPEVPSDADGPYLAITVVGERGWRRTLLITVVAAYVIVLLYCAAYGAVSTILALGGGR